MSYTTYGEYKDSKIKWIGEIPKHWRINKLKQYFFIINGSTPKNFEENWGGDICWVTPADYKTTDVYIDNSSRQITKIGLNSCGTTLVPKGSIIVSNRAPIGTVAIANKELCTNQGCKSLKVKRDINTKFIYYILSVNENELNRLGRGTTFMELSSQDLGTFQIPLAPLPEQNSIVNYLDKKTAKIDATIAKNEELIQLLEEKRVALINQVVTKGLNPDVPMKDSGVEWIGEIPEHWECRKINTLSSVSRGASPRPIDDPIYFDDDGEYSWVRISDVTSSNKYLEQTTEKLSTLGKSLSVPIEPGNIFVSIAATVGKPIIANIKCCIHDGFVYFKNLNLNDEYLFYIFAGGEAYKGLGKLGTQLNLNTETIGRIHIPVPPKDEQIGIVKYLDYEIEKIDKTIEKIQKNITLLEEYKTSLIHHVVTGKIDVRSEEI